MTYTRKPAMRMRRRAARASAAPTIKASRPKALAPPTLSRIQYGKEYVAAAPGAVAVIAMRGKTNQVNPAAKIP